MCVRLRIRMNMCARLCMCMSMCKHVCACAFVCHEHAFDSICPFKISATKARPRQAVASRHGAAWRKSEMTRAALCVDATCSWTCVCGKGAKTDARHKIRFNETAQVLTSWPYPQSSRAFLQRSLLVRQKPTKRYEIFIF